jgi:hypothetical protein
VVSRRVAVHPTSDQEPDDKPSENDRAEDPRRQEALQRGCLREAREVCHGFAMVIARDEGRGSILSRDPGKRSWQWKRVRRR